MAASKTQKEQAARLLAAGKTESETAEAIGVSRSSIQGWKRKAHFQSMIENSRITVELAQVGQREETAVSSHMILQGIAALQISEADIATRFWSLFDKVEKKTLAFLEATEVEDLSPRQLPSFIKTCTDVVQVGLAINDRINGLEVLADEIQKIDAARAA